MKNFRFNEELLKGGYFFLADGEGHAKYILINKGQVTGSFAVDFSEINTYYNLVKYLNEYCYLLVYYEPLFKRYKAMIVDVDLLKRYPLIAKLLGYGKIPAVEVQGILSILNTKIRQHEWSNVEIERTNMDNIPTLTHNKRKN